MAKFKKSAGKKSSGRASNSAQAKAERLSNSLSESAQQIWLAGVGAFGRAQAEGTRLFEGLVKEGLNLEQTARKFAGHRADTVRDSVESTVGQARERAADTWDRLEKVFEDRVQGALVKLGVPNRDDLNGLSRKVDTLTSELRRQDTGPRRASKPARVVGAKKAVAKKVSKKAVAKKAVSKKAVAKKSVAKKAAGTRAPTKAPNKPAAKRVTKSVRKSPTLSSIATPTPPIAP